MHNATLKSWRWHSAAEIPALSPVEKAA